MEALLLRPQGVVAAALHPRRRSRLRLHTRAQANHLHLHLVSIDDDLRLPRDGGAAYDDHAAVNGCTPSHGDGTAAQRLRAIAEAAADRADMHDIIGRQRDNWNHLLLHATNSLALTASLLSAVTLAPGTCPTTLTTRASAGTLLATAAVTMAAVNTIQPSQLAEEQRNATRIWRQLERSIRAAALLDDDHATADDGGHQHYRKLELPWRP